MYNRFRKYLSTFAATSVLALSSAAWADDYLLKIDGIKGESTIQKDEIDVTAFSWGFSTPDGQTKAQPQRLVISKFVDSASPALTQQLFDGRVIKNLTLTVRRPRGKDAATFIAIKVDLTDVRVVDIHVSAGGNQRPVESVAFAFSKVTFQYTPLDVSGKPVGASSATLDFATQKR
jgi:type VI secretion system secreted protein Hcp